MDGESCVSSSGVVDASAMMISLKLLSAGWCRQLWIPLISFKVGMMTLMEDMDDFFLCGQM